MSNRITLVYTDKPLPALTYLSGLDFDAYLTTNEITGWQGIFHPTTNMPMQNEKITREYITLRGRQGQDTLHAHRIWSVELSSNDIDYTKLEQLLNLWKSPYQYIAEKKWSNGAWTNYIEVICTDKNFPIAFDDNNVLFPVITFNFKAVNPGAGWHNQS
ncbi:MAG: hypothetical protein M9949_04595 [Candidatus Kapabacteria bacterium]|nr:hypothetical protein [Candidatus Kapabacteria bacterium]